MKILYKISDFLFFIIYEIWAYRKRVVIQNISRAFPEKKYSEIRLIEQNFYRNFADIFVEVIKSISISPRKQKEKLEIKGFDFVENQIKKGKNVIACLGHCGNWEILNCLPAKVEFDIYSCYKPIKASMINQLMFKIRSRFGMHLISSKSIAKQILSNKDKPSLYLMIADQCPPNINSDFKMPFLNQETSVFPGTEKLARATHSSVVYIKQTRVKRGHFEVECQPICENADEIQYLGITKTYISLLEQNIQQDPSCWLWSHKRWKR